MDASPTSLGVGPQSLGGGRWSCAITQFQKFSQANPGDAKHSSLPSPLSPAPQGGPDLIRGICLGFILQPISCWACHTTSVTLDFCSFLFPVGQLETLPAPGCFHLASAQHLAVHADGTVLFLFLFFPNLVNPKES